MLCGFCRVCRGSFLSLFGLRLRGEFRVKGILKCLSLGSKGFGGYGSYRVYRETLHRRGLGSGIGVSGLRVSRICEWRSLL